MDPEYEAEFYEKDNNKRPVEEFIDALSEKDQAKYKRSLLNHLLKGNPADVVHKVNEFVQMRWGRHRVLCHLEGKTYWLLHAFTKGSKKTPKTDIEKARLHLKDLQKRNQEKKNEK